MPKALSLLAGIAIAAAAFGFMFSKGTSGYNEKACAEPPLRTLEARNAAIEAGYRINIQYDCIDKQSFDEVNAYQRKSESAK